MALYTGKGDKGDTGLFGCNQRISKSSAIAEALGSLDEINSFLGLIKVKAKDSNAISEGKSIEFKINDLPFDEIVNTVQKNLFIVQAEVAGTPMTIEESKVKEVEVIIAQVEKELPPIHSFFISGGTELTALFDVARTFVRRAERRVVGVSEEGERKVGEFTLAYMNRLSSLFYALARLTNHISGIVEQSPDYK